MKTPLHIATAFLVLLVAIAMAPMTASRANAQAAAPLGDTLAGFAADSYSDTEKAIIAVAASGNPRAEEIISALQDGRLLFSPSTKQIYVKTQAGAVQDAASGQPAQAAADATPVRLNNRVRRALEAASGSLSLLAPDPGKRRAAADAVFKSREDSALPALQTAIAQEKIASIKKVMLQAQAAIVLMKADAPELDKISAVAVIRDRGDQDALAMLSALPADAPASVRDAAASARSSIQTQLTIWSYVQNAWYGLSLGSVLLLAAIGLAITFGVMGVINMAHGEMVMLGAYTTFVVQELIRTYNPALFDYSLFIALPLAFAFAGCVGIFIERTVIRFLYGRPLETLLATWGISLILQQAVRNVFGANNREVGAPSWMSGTFEVGYLNITYGRLWIIVFTAFVFLGLLALLRYTRLGLEMRAVTQNRRMAASVGIRTNRIDALTFGLGSGIAGVAGVALSQIDNVSPNLGQSYIIDSFLVVVFGGVGNLWGTLVAALTLGVANKFLEPLAGAVLAKIMLLIFIILFIQKRPRGLFALKGRAIEA
jgi:urea transport system permease protein